MRATPIVFISVSVRIIGDPIYCPIHNQYFGRLRIKDWLNSSQLSWVFDEE